VKEEEEVDFVSLKLSEVRELVEMKNEELKAENPDT